MGQVGTLHRIKKSDLENIAKKKGFDEKDIVDMDKRWEATMYVLSGGFPWSPPFDTILMPKNVIEVPDDGSCRYHNEADIKAMNIHLSEVSEAKIRARAEDKIAQNDKDLIIEDVMTIIEIFKNAETEGDVIVASIG